VAGERRPAGFAERWALWDDPLRVQVDVDVRVGLFREVEDPTRIPVEFVNYILKQTTTSESNSGISQVYQREEKY